MCYEGVWGTVCRDSQWDNNDASVVCRQLGFSPYGIEHIFLLTVLHQTGSLAVTNSWFYENDKISFITGADCVGTETNIFDCPANPQIVCPQRNDANVVCPGKYITGDAYVIFFLSSWCYIFQLY